MVFGNQKPSKTLMLLLSACVCRFLGSSGQPVSDMYRFSSAEDHLKLLENTLVWGHLAPTAPDTLGKGKIGLT